MSFHQNFHPDIVSPKRLLTMDEPENNNLKNKRTTKTKFGKENEFFRMSPRMRRIEVTEKGH